MKTIFTAIIVVFSVFQLQAVINCECGEHSVGITAYSVNGDSCCTGLPYAVAYIHHYVLNDASGVWEHTGSTEITGTQAQNRCCPST